MTGDHSAGLCTTVQPAASAGAIFQVDSMNGVFHGVMTPTGPIGTRVETFQCSSLGVLRPSRASAHLSAKKRKFSARADRGLGHEAVGLAGVDAFQHGDVVGARLDRVGDRVQQLLARSPPAMSRQAGKARCGGLGGAVDVLGSAARDLRQHRVVDRRLASRTSRRTIDGTILPSIRWPMPSALQLLQQRRGAVAIGLQHVG